MSSVRYGSIPALASTCLALIFCAAATLPLASLTTVTAPDLALLPLMETALITALEAPLAPLWVWLAFGETPEAATLIGGGVVLTAVLANSVRANRQASLPR